MKAVWHFLVLLPLRRCAGGDDYAIRVAVCEGYREVFVSMQDDVNVTLAKFQQPFSFFEFRVAPRMFEIFHHKASPKLI